jgi:hypothetical protein
VAESLDPWLFQQFREVAKSQGVVATLSTGKVNRIADVTPEGVWISTDASDRKGTGPRLVDAAMLNRAWRHLEREGSLTNAYLQADDGLSVKRSSAVCALLARLPSVEIASGRPIKLRRRERSA